MSVRVRWFDAAVTTALTVAGMLQVATLPATPATAAPANDPVISRPDVVSARLAAAAQDSRVHVTGLDDEYSTTYVNPDGTLTTDTSLAPQRIQQGGGWVGVDYDLVHVEGGWSPKASPVPVGFSDGGDTDAADLGSGSRELTQSWAVKLPKPVIDGAEASYDLGDGQTLLLRATSTGFEQSLILAHAPAALPQLRLPFDVSSMSMSGDGAGGYVFTSASGADVYTMPQPTMWGAAVGEDGEPTQSHAVSSQLVQTADGPRLDLTPSLSWLQDPNLTYPVTIDPTISKVTGAADAFAQDNLATSTSSLSYLHAGEYKLSNGTTTPRGRSCAGRGSARWRASTSSAQAWACTTTRPTPAPTPPSTPTGSPRPSA